MIRPTPYDERESVLSIWESGGFVASSRLPIDRYMPTFVRTILLATFLLFAAGSTIAQQAPTAFVDCNTRGCDSDYFQTEVAFVQHVRDRSDADLYVLVTSESTGGGGSLYTLFFEEQRALAGRYDTLTVSVAESSSHDERRSVLARRIALGFAGLTVDTPFANRLRITAESPTTSEANGDPEQSSDPWKNWVFRIRGSGFFNGQQSTRSANVFGNLTAERVTDAHKFSFRVFSSYNRSDFEIDDTTTVTSTSRSYGGSTLTVWSLSNNWSVGGQSFAESSSFQNYDFRLRAGPAIEYSVYPYRESTRRSFRLLYFVGVEIADYAEETIFEKTGETQPRHSLTSTVEFEQPWGSVDVSLDLSQYLAQPSKYRAEFFGGFNLQLVRGLSLNLHGSYARVRDQLALPATGATPEEILTEQRALASSYNYFASVGLTYSFGSIFNPVVNPRFDN